MKRILLFAAALCACGTAAADEGMWLLPYLQKMNIADMRDKGCRLKAEDIYRIDGSSLKDAIVVFGRGCTGEIVSPEGLVFTNHHCGYGSIQALSSVDHDYLKNGFWAMNNAEELPVPGLEIRFVRRILDVTPDLLGNVPNIAGEAERALLARIVAESAAAFATPLNDPYAAVLERRRQAPYGGEQLLCAALEELLIRMIRRGAAPAPAARSREDAGALEQVMDYLSARLDRQLTLEEICQDNLVGRSQLQKLFHTHTGGGVMEYFIGLKMQAARRMIREGALNFTQIAARLGFQSVHYFSRRFRQVTGMSPSEYERSVKMLLELGGVYPDDRANNG